MRHIPAFDIVATMPNLMVLARPHEERSEVIKRGYSLCWEACEWPLIKRTLVRLLGLVETFVSHLQTSPTAHGRRPKWTSRSRNTPKSPNATASEKRVAPREATLWRFHRKFRTRSYDVMIDRSIRHQSQA